MHRIYIVVMIAVMVYIGFTQHVYICKLVHMQSHPIIVMYVQTLDGIANELVDHNARFRP